MRSLLASVVILSLLVIGCGTSKDYVAQQIQQSEAKQSAQISALSDKTNANADQIAKLQSLATEISAKADKAINEAKGFENYQIIWQGEINFDFDSYAITPTAEQIMMECGQKMEANPSSIIEITGNTDRIGSAKYNYMLGMERAESAKRFLSNKFGISLYRMFVISYGKDKPVATAGETQSASKNRRVTLTVWGELQ